ncbi:MAG TPA: HAD-IB family phosphatase [Steroidobacteraceae bacterium]|nr:HAD-IB family phosphatase [Steroidobacteraceae bacterium]
MSAPNETENPRGVAVFDLDGTLTRRDTLLPFLCGYLARHPRRLLRLWRLPPAVAAYLLAGHDRALLKSRLIRIAMRGDARAAVDRWADAFVASLRAHGAFRAAALRCVERHRRAGDALVLLSASPDLYVPRIAAALGFESTICTEVRWRGDRLDGALATANRRGEEKRRCLLALRAEFPGRPTTAYGNSAADLAYLGLADRGVLVNARGAARRAARAAGIAVDVWR